MKVKTKAVKRRKVESDGAFLERGRCIKDALPGQLSGGQQQRVAIARVLGDGAARNVV